MAGFPEIKNAIDKQGEAIEAFVTRSQKSTEALRTDFDALRDRLEDIESKGNTPSRPTNDAASREHIKHYHGDIVALTQAMLESWAPGQQRDLTRDLQQLTLAIVMRALFDWG